MTFETTLQKFDSDLWGYHFPVPDDVSAQFIDGNDRRVICTVNGQEHIRSGLMPHNGHYFILVNKKLREKLGIKPGSVVTLTLEKDSSKYGMEMPESF